MSLLFLFGGSLAHRTLAADAGSYTHTGTVASLERGLEVVADAGNYAHNGIAASLEFGREVAASSGSYAQTGTAASLERGFNVAAAAGSYAHTGQAASLEVGREVAAAAGSYAHTGDAVTFVRGFAVSSDPGAYAHTGQAAGLRSTRLLAADAGAYTHTGTAAALAKGRTIAAAAGAYAHSGSAAALEYVRRISAAAGAYAHTGQAASLEFSRHVSASAGAYALNGTAASLEIGREVSAGAGSYALVGTDATLVHEGFYLLDFTDNAGLYQSLDTSSPVTAAGQSVQRIDKDGVVATLAAGSVVWQASGLVTSGSVRMNVASPFELRGAVIAATPSTGDTSNNHGILGGTTNYLTISAGVYRWRDDVDSATSTMLSRSVMQIGAFALDEGTGLVRAWMDGVEGETEDLKSPLLIERFFHRGTTTVYNGTVAYMALSPNAAFSDASRRAQIKAAAEASWTLPAGRIMLMADDVPLNCHVQGTDDPDQPVLISHHGLSGKTLDEGVEGTYGSDRYNAATFASTYGLQAFSPTFDEVRFAGSDNYQQGGYVSGGRRTADLEAGLVASVREHLGQPSKPVLIYGFSAGAQWLSRVAAYAPPSDVQRYVVGAPSTWVVPIRTPTGTYTTADAPYGFAGLGLTSGEADDAIRAYLQLPLTVYCGSLDNDPNDPDLGDPTNTLGQGTDRLDRAENVFAMAQSQAAALGVTLGWQLVVASGVGHSGTSMLNAPEAEQAFFPEGILISAGAGSYALTGAAVSLEFGREVAAAAGSYAHSGTAAALERGLEVAAGDGSYVHTGQPVALEATRLISSGAGSYVHTGTAAALEVGREVTAGVGSYAHSTTQAALEYGREVTAATGSYALIGAAASLEFGREVVAGSGAYAHTGSAATLEHTEVGHFDIEADAGSYAHSGSAASLERATLITAQSASYAHTGSVAGLSRGRFVTAGVGSYAVVAAASGLELGRLLSAQPGSILLSGTSAGLVVARHLVAESASYAHDGADASLATGLAPTYTIGADAGSYHHTGVDVGVHYGRNPRPTGASVLRPAALIGSGRPSSAVTAKRPAALYDETSSSIIPVVRR